MTGGTRLKYKHKQKRLQCLQNKHDRNIYRVYKIKYFVKYRNIYCTLLFIYICLLKSSK